MAGGILGIDPGIRNTGWALVRNGRPTKWGLWETPGEGRLTSAMVLAWVLPKLGALVAAEKPTSAAVEEVVWQGRAKRIALPLAHVAGAIAALLVARGVRVLLVSPNMKDHDALVLRGDPSPHELDAARLAMRARDADGVAGDTGRSKRSRAEAQRIIAARSVPGLPCKGE